MQDRRRAVGLNSQQFALQFFGEGQVVALVDPWVAGNRGEEYVLLGTSGLAVDRLEFFPVGHHVDITIVEESRIQLPAHVDDL